MKIGSDPLPFFFKREDLRFNFLPVKPLGDALLPDHGDDKIQQHDTKYGSSNQGSKVDFCFLGIHNTAQAKMRLTNRFTKTRMMKILE